MILIFSSPEEPTTDLVINWLNSKGANYRRIHGEDLLQKDFLVDVLNDKIIIGNEEIEMADVNTVWYRRWYKYRAKVPLKNRHYRQLRHEVVEELNTLSDYIFKVFAQKKWLTNPFVNRLHNKLDALRVAKECGLNIPDTLLTNDKQQLLKFYHRNNKEIVSKAIADPYVYIDDEGANYKCYTEKLSYEFIENLGDYFHTSPFQQFIESDYELRIFYLDGAFYPTAIVHSETTDIKLSVSFGKSKVNMIAYTLPDSIKQKLKKTMDALNLNTCSIDMLKTKDGEYYFLEGNPIGQFMGYGAALNYNLDEKVANWLIKNDH
ncbi:MAG: hypothetical protein AAGG75_03715 [Bacteroidota bacterium]